MPFTKGIKYTNREPKPGDKLVITDYTNFTAKQALELSKLPFVTVEDSCGVPIGQNGDYTMCYDVYIKECEDPIGINSYKFLN